ncbi:MAG: hypothetical protein FWD75_07975 [Propionibacteriaceae bacterium]|nr:hypothetical protein [Propionibacteriaceae bacterium]
MNYYDELGIDRTAGIAEIREGLKNLKLQLMNKVARPGSQQEKWKHQLELVGQAEEAFRDDYSRERYDVLLRRAGEVPEEEAQVDWTTRAFNYYYSEDYGAAMIASRKAKEQSPNHPMPYVASAWVYLHDKEWKQAKQDADEAFVLDELTTDSVDVQLVRGVAYFFVGDTDRALSSYDRALAKATDGEKSEIYWRKAVVYNSMRKWQECFDSAFRSLTAGVDMIQKIREGAEVLLSHSYNCLDNTSDPSKSIENYTARRGMVAKASMDASSKNRLTDNITENIERCQELRRALDTRKEAEAERGKLEAERNDLCEFKAPAGPRPAIPLVAILAAIVVFFIMIGMYQVSPGAGMFFLLVVGAIVAYVAVRSSKRSQWTRATELFQQAQVRIGEIDQARFQPLPSVPANTPIELAK